MHVCMYVCMCVSSGSWAAQVELSGHAGLQHLGDHVAHRLELLLALHHVRRSALQKNLYVCMYVCMYVFMCMCVYACACVYICMYAYMYVYIYMYIHVYIRICAYVCICLICMYVRICMYVYVYLDE